MRGRSIFIDTIDTLPDGQPRVWVDKELHPGRYHYRLARCSCPNGPVAEEQRFASLGVSPIEPLAVFVRID